MTKNAESGLKVQDSQRSKGSGNTEKEVKRSNDKLIEEKELIEDEMVDRKKGKLVKFKTSYGWVSFRTKKKKGR